MQCYAQLYAVGCPSPSFAPAFSASGEPALAVVMWSSHLLPLTWLPSSLKSLNQTNCIPLLHPLFCISFLPPYIAFLLLCFVLWYGVPIDVQWFTKKKKKSYDIATVCHNFRILSVSRTRFVRSTDELPLGAFYTHSNVFRILTYQQRHGREFRLTTPWWK